MRLPDVALLSADDEIELATRIEVGLAASMRLSGPHLIDDELALRRLVSEGEEARERMWLANLRLVAWLIRGVADRVGLTYDELFQAGCEGLGDAIWRWDCRRGVRFATFAKHRIRATVGDVIRSRGGAWSSHVGRTRTKVRQMAQRLTIERGASPTWAELAQACGVSETIVEQALSFDVSLDAMPEPSLDVENVDDDREWVRTLLDLLPSLERRVIELRFGLSRDACTQEQVGRTLSSSASSVARIERQALKHLRELADAA